MSGEIEQRFELVVFEPVPEGLAIPVYVGGTTYVGMNEAGLERTRADLRRQKHKGPEPFTVYRLTAAENTAKADVLRALILREVAKRRAAMN